MLLGQSAQFYSSIGNKAELVLRKVEQKLWGFEPYRVHTGPMEHHIALSNTLVHTVAGQMKGCPEHG